MASPIGSSPFLKLPPDIGAEIGRSYLKPEDIFSLRLASKGDKEFVDKFLKIFWRSLEKKAPEGPVEMPSVMAEIAKDNPEIDKPLNCFWKLTEKFVQNGVEITDKLLPITAPQFKCLQDSVKIEQDRALVTIWPQIASYLSLPLQFQSDTIRQWLNSSPAQAALYISLDLDSRGLRVLPSEIAKLKYLKELFLSGNKLKDLPVTIGDFDQLKILFIARNQLKTLPDAIGTLTKLKTLNVSDNKLKTLPITISALTELQVLNIHNNHLETLPDEIRTLTELQELYLSYNWIKIFPTALGALTGLLKLELHHNQLENVPPDGIRTLTKLEQLYLAHNQLKILPDTIGLLVELRKLWLNYNQLEDLPVTMGALTGLRTLELCYNQFQSLPKVVRAFTGLLSFSFHVNPLMFVPDEVLSSNLAREETIQDFTKELEYPSNFPLAKLYSAIIHKEPEDEIKTLFNTLFKDDQALIFEMLLVYSGNPQGSRQWSEDHVYDNMSIFYRAVREAIRSKFERVSSDEKNQIYENIRTLTNRFYPSEEQWEEYKSQRNLPLLADAMDLWKFEKS